MSKKAILKGGEYLIRESSCEEVFSPEDFTEEQKMMRDSVQEFTDRKIVANHEKFENHDYALTEKILRKAGDLGFLGVTLPKEYNGMGMDFTSDTLVCDIISGATGSFATAFGAHTGIGTLPIALYGTKEQQKKYLPKLATGEWIGAYALTEPGSGSDANSGKTSAKLTDDEKYYLINGQKMWISNAGFAQVFTVFARIGDDKNLSAFIVEYDKEHPNGISFGDEEHKLGIHGSSTRQVFFNDTKIPAGNRLSKRGDGFKIAMYILNMGRFKLGAACVSSQRRVTNNALDYARERKQFNTEIIHFEAIKSKLAQMATNTYVCESIAYRYAKMIDEKIDELKADGCTPEEAKLEAVREYAVECSLMKVNVSEDIQEVSDEGIQIYGGMGFSKDTPMESAWRDARIPRIYEGTNEINRMHAVGMLIEKAMKGKVDLLAAAKGIQKELTSIPSFDVPDYSTLFAEEKALLEKLKKCFLMVAGSAVQRYTTALEEQQNILMNIADIMIQILRAESALLRTEKLAKREGESSCEGRIAMSKLTLYQATEIVATKARESIISFASGDEQKTLLMGLKRFTKYQNYPNISALKNSIADKLNAEGKYCF